MLFSAFDKKEQAFFWEFAAIAILDSMFFLITRIIFLLDVDDATECFLRLFSASDLVLRFSLISFELTLSDYYLYLNFYNIYTYGFYD